MADADSVRLYHLGDDGVVATLCYGTIADAIALAMTQPDAIRDALYLQTGNDVVAFADFAEG